MFIDTHCHLDFPEFDHDRDKVIKDAKEGGIGFIINVGSSLKSSLASLELSQRYDFLYAVVGVHPHEADAYNESVGSRIKELARSDKVVAIGETGLDYYLPAGQAGRNYSKAENQKPLFESLITLSKDLNLPLVIHSRQAQSDTLEILKKAMPLKAVVHCFSGDDNFLRECLDLGFLVSFTCNITYKKAQNLRDIVKLTPLERIMLETDAPYLSPEGLRGRRNDPLNVKYAADTVARVKQITVEEVADVTAKTAKEFFNIK